MIKMTSERPLYVQGEARTEFEVPEHEARELEEAGMAVRVGEKPAGAGQGEGGGAGGSGAAKPSDGLKVEDIKSALAARGIAIPEGVTLKADLAKLLDDAPAA